MVPCVACCPLVSFVHAWLQALVVASVFFQGAPAAWDLQATFGFFGLFFWLGGLQGYRGALAR